MTTINAVPITKEQFAPFGRYINLFDVPARISEDFEAYTTREVLADEPMNLGYTICKAADEFDTISMERHLLTEEPQVCGDGEMVLTVADSPPNKAPRAEDIRAFILKPGDAVVIFKGIWHDANHGVEKNTYYYFLATYKDPENLLGETTWVDVQPQPVRVRVRRDDK